MVLVNRPVNFCDIHLDEEEKEVLGETIHLAIKTNKGLTAKRIDVCPKCFEVYISPFMAILNGHGETITEKTKLILPGQDSGRILSPKKIEEPKEIPVVLNGLPIISKEEAEISRGQKKTPRKRGAKTPEWTSKVGAVCLYKEDGEVCGDHMIVSSRPNHSLNHHGIQAYLVPWKLVGMPVGVEPAKCPECGMPFPSEVSLPAHIRYTHKTA